MLYISAFISNNRKLAGRCRGWVALPTSRSPVHVSVVSVRLYLHLPPERSLRLDRFALFFTLRLSAGCCNLHACAAEFIPTSTEKRAILGSLKLSVRLNGRFVEYLVD